MCTERDFNLVILSKLLHILECLHPLKILIKLRNKENGDSFNLVYSILIIEQYYKSNHVYVIFLGVCRKTISTPLSSFILENSCRKTNLKHEMGNTHFKTKGEISKALYIMV